MTLVSVAADRCVGHGRYYPLAPDVVDADEGGHPTVRVAQVSGKQNCPEQPITLSR